MTKYIGKGRTTMRKAMKDLRVAIDNDPDPIVRRVAYGMEMVLRWSRMDTKGWKTPVEEAKATAELLRDELKLPPPGDGGKHS